MKETKIRTRFGCALLIGGFLLTVGVLSEAREGQIFWTQGRINSGGDLNSGYLLINEMRVYLNSSTRVMDHRGTDIDPAGLKPKKWVYLELEKEGEKNRLKARKVYLLPHYVGPDQKRQFVFMK